MFRALCAHHQAVKIALYCTWYHHTCKWPSRAQVERSLLSTLFRALCAHHQEVKIALYCIWYHHTCKWPSRARVERSLLSTYRCDDTRCCI